ncbi:hypothetical protein GPJ56_004166 [Histomonas meleagridis]|uniref:uncharacterized protein n=1 Tax=Histomonas meleagridis TaxID=135588 RepID=UPI0035599A5A|nr:hypothetical protein GPJ56_004166 [Histomonas meleagridis]KAH0801507.1 hypothetical protein GO595_005759 [Histomonas meleagridis]
MKEQSKPLLGLKASPLPAFLGSNDSDDDEDIFCDDSDDGSLSFKKSPLLPPMETTPKPSKKPEETNQISSFDEALPKITLFLSTLDEYTIPEQYSGDLYFVPDHVATTENLSMKLQKLVNENIDEFDTELQNINISAQVSIVKYRTDKSIDLKEFITPNTDSRVLTIIYFLLSKTDNQKESLYYSIQAISEFVKSTEVAPISSLFEDFKIQTIIHKIAVCLIGLFPHHPILESVLNRLSRYDSSIPELFSFIQENDDDDDFDFDDDDDSFFESIQEMQQRPAPLMLQSRAIRENPLDNLQPAASKVFTVTVAEPPFSVTFCLTNGSSQLTPNQFVDWITALNSGNPIPIPIKKSRIDSNNNTCLSGTPNPPHDVSDENLSSNVEATEETILELFNSTPDSQMLLTTIPSQLPPNLFPLYYPLFQIANLSAIKPFKRGFIYPSLLENEYMAHQGLINGNIEEIQDAINNMLKRVPSDCNLKPIKPLTPKREFKTSEIEKENENLITALSLADIEIVLHGRSPFTLNQMSQEALIQIPYDRKWRSQAY